MKLNFKIKKKKKGYFQYKISLLMMFISFLAFNKCVKIKNDNITENLQKEKRDSKLDLNKESINVKIENSSIKGESKREDNGFYTEGNLLSVMANSNNNKSTQGLVRKIENEELNKPIKDNIFQELKKLKMEINMAGMKDNRNKDKNDNNVEQNKNLKAKSKEVGNNSDIQPTIRTDFLLNNWSEAMKSFYTFNKRNSYKEINEFCQFFRYNMITLLNLSNIFEQSATLKIQNLANEMIDVIGLNIDPKIKKDIIQQKLEKLEKIVESQFSSILSKIEEYHKVSNIKIDRMQSNVLGKLAYFIALPKDSKQKREFKVFNNVAQYEQMLNHK